jgi:ADP-L-glycero-D-manno-heptose 6-epimerase
MKKVVVTGGAGFIGSAFIHKLNREGIEDILVVDALGKNEKWKNLAGLSYTDYLHKNVFIDQVISDTLDFQPQAIVHMGACSRTTERDADYLMENNYRFTRRLAKWAVERGIRFIYASSAATYGDGENGFSDAADIEMLRPLNRYGYSKHVFDLYARRTGLLDHITGLKFFNVFGPNEYHKGDMTSVVFKAFNQIQETGRVELFKSHRNDYADGEQKRDFLYIKDCVDIMWWLVNREEITGLYNLGSGEARTWNDLAASIFSAIDLPSDIHYINMPEILRGSYQYYSQADIRKLQSTGCPLNFRSLEEAILDYVTNHLRRPRQYLSL